MFHNDANTTYMELQISLTVIGLLSFADGVEFIFNEVLYMAFAGLLFVCNFQNFRLLDLILVFPLFVIIIEEGACIYSCLIKVFWGKENL